VIVTRARIEATGEEANMNVTNRADTVPDWGVDLADETRPGVPMEHAPAPAGNAHWSVPEAQNGEPTAMKTAPLGGSTPVFGTAQPPKGLSGLLRKAAYRIPEHKVKRWLMLLMADRVDIAEHNIVRFGPFALLSLPVIASVAYFTMRPRKRGLFAWI
jgi:hypothetical protein